VARSRLPRGGEYTGEGSKLIERRGVKVFVDEPQVLNVALAMPGNERAYEFAHRVLSYGSARVGDIDQVGSLEPTAVARF
jgi:hypothetical protein